MEEIEVQKNIESKPVSTPFISFILKKIINIDIFPLVGEVIKDMVLTVIVITYLANNLLLKAITMNAELYILIYSFAIMLVPLSVTVKWLRVIFKEEDKVK